MSLAKDKMDCDVLIIGAGAAGMMAAIEAGKRGRSVILLEQAKAPGRKIRISGGGRCNFTNLNSSPEHFLSDNPRFCISALSRYQPSDFVRWVEDEGIAYHEKDLGQLFCDGSAAQIVSMLTRACDEAGVRIETEVAVESVRSGESGFEVHSEGESWRSGVLVVACGGPSIPKMGSSRLGYKIAAQFDIPVVEPEAALVPLTFSGTLGERIAALSGLSLPVSVRSVRRSFDDAMLFTHRGLSGPAILQISSFWRPGETIVIDLLPGHDLSELVQRGRQDQPSQRVEATLSHKLPKRLARAICEELQLAGSLAELSKKKTEALARRVHAWEILPMGTEGMRTAEVTRGGVDTRALSPTTMESKAIPGLYFIGEVVDVTGELGGHNFQWAWASGQACGQVI